LKPMSLYAWLLVFRKRWLFIMLAAAIGGGTAAYISLHVTTPIYANTATLLVNEKNRQSPSLSLNEVMMYEKLMGTYKDIIMSKRILYPVAERFGHGITPANIGQYVRVSTKANSQIISITVQHSDHSVATELSNAVADAFKDNLVDIMTVDNVQILDYALPNASPAPVKPNKALNTALGLMLGLAASVTVTALLHLLDTRIRTEEDLTDVLHYPLLGTVPSFSQIKRKTFYH
jgi:capsular polysaccharide biosynthesis protein